MSIIFKELKMRVNKQKAKDLSWFFKTGKGAQSRCDHGVHCPPRLILISSIVRIDPSRELKFYIQKLIHHFYHP